MLDEDEPRQKPRLPSVALDPLGVGELHEYIADLRAEIARAEATIQRKQSHRDAASAFFRTP